MFNYYKAKTFSIVFAVSYIMLGSVIGAFAQEDFKSMDSVPEPLTHENEISSPSVFGGVGRKLPTWQFGLDFIILGNPHYSAKRNRLKLENYVFWGEWWNSDLLGFKLMHSEQTFSMFDRTGDKPESYSRHLGFLAKVQHSLEVDKKISAGIGFSNTEFELNNQRKYGSSLLSEFRIGIEFFPRVWIEGGFLTVDGSSGNGPDDQRLGSSSYLVGVSLGF